MIVKTLETSTLLFINKIRQSILSKVCELA